MKRGQVKSKDSAIYVKDDRRKEAGGGCGRLSAGEKTLKIGQQFNQGRFHQSIIKKDINVESNVKPIM